MKVIAVALLALLGVTAAVPPPKEISLPGLETSRNASPRIIEGIVSSVVEDVSQQIRQAGLDPFEFNGIRQNIGLPVPVLLDVNVHVEDIRASGLSNIVINNVHYGALNFRLTLDVSLPEIMITVGDAGFDVTILGNRIHGEAKNLRLAVREVGVSGVIQVGVGIISGITVRDIDLQFNLDSLQFIGHVNLLDRDYSSDVSSFVTTWIPTKLHELKNEINELVEIIAWQVVDMIL